MRYQLNGAVLVNGFKLMSGSSRRFLSYLVVSVGGFSVIAWFQWEVFELLGGFRGRFFKLLGGFCGRFES